MEPSRQTPAYEVIPGKVRPGRLAKLIERDLDEHGHASVLLHGFGGASPRTVHAVCIAVAPIQAFDQSGTTRPWHPILKKTDRGDLTTSTAADVPFALELSRWGHHPWWPPEWTPQPGGVMVSPEEDEVGIRYVYG